MPDVAFVVIDTETTGLDTDSVYMLEVGIVVADMDLNVIDTFDTLVAQPNLLRVLHHLEAIADRTAADLEFCTPEEIENAKWVVAQHKMSGLWDRLVRGLDASVIPGPADVSRMAVEFLTKHNALEMPMVGSNVANFDRPILRRILPTLEKQFHYRNTDVSSLKTFAMTFDPEEYASRKDKLKPKQLHRCVADCVDTLAELGMYRDWFLWNTPGDPVPVDITLPRRQNITRHIIVARNRERARAYIQTLQDVQPGDCVIIPSNGDACVWEGYDTRDLAVHLVGERLSKNAWEMLGVRARARGNGDTVASMVERGASWPKK